MKIILSLFLLVNIIYGDKLLKIASYNVENLFDLDKSGYEYEEYIPNTKSNWNLKTYNIKLKNIAKVIQEIDADIIALQEIESLQALKDLRLELKKQGLYYQYFKIANRKKTITKVAILSKIPFNATHELVVTSSYIYRNILEVKYTIENKELYLFINHWKAKTGPESQRIVSAKVLRKRIQKLGAEKNIILLGDFNSDYQEYIKFTRKRRHNDTAGKTGLNDILKSKKQTQKANAVSFEKDNFYNTWFDTTEQERWTYIYKSEKEALDNILISQSLLNKKNIYYQYNSIHAYKPSYLLKKKSINRWSTSWKKPRRHKGKGYSDHLAVIAEFIVEEDTN